MDANRRCRPSTLPLALVASGRNAAIQAALKIIQSPRPSAIGQQALVSPREPSLSLKSQKLSLALISFPRLLLFSAFPGRMLPNPGALPFHVPRLLLCSAGGGMNIFRVYYFVDEPYFHSPEYEVPRSIKGVPARFLLHWFECSKGTLKITAGFSRTRIIAATTPNPLAADTI
jgi:hypothetical protein